MADKKTPKEAEVPKEAEAPEAVSQEASEEVVLKKDEFHYLVDTVKGLQSKVSDLQREKNGIMDLEYIKEHFAHIRLYEGGIVREVGKSWNDVDPRNGNQQIPWISFKADNQEEDVKMPLIDFTSELEKVRVKILDRIVLDEGVHVVDYVPVITYDYSNYKALNTGQRVAQKVTTPVYALKLELPDGSVETLPENAVTGQ